MHIYLGVYIQYQHFNEILKFSFLLKDLKVYLCVHTYVHL